MAYFGGKGKSASLEEDLNKIINDETFYKEVLEKVASPCQFCNAVYEIMIKINDQRGAIQVKVPSRDELVAEFKKWNNNSETGKLTKEQCREIMKRVMKPESLSVGRSAMEAVICIFGAPIVAFLAKRFIPGGGRVSDDVMLPAVTSLAVVFLATTNRL